MCETPIGLVIQSPSNGQSFSIQSVTIQGQISDLGATLTMNGTPIVPNINGSFSLNETLPNASNSFVFEATNGDTSCDEQYTLVLNVG